MKGKCKIKEREEERLFTITIIEVKKIAIA